MYLTKETKEKVLDELHWMAFLLEGDLKRGDWSAEAFAARVMECAADTARAIEKLGAPAREP